MTDYIVVGIFILVGLLSSVGGIMNADWLLKSHQVSFFVRLMGEKGTRFFYIFFGFFCVLAGILLFVTLKNH